MVSTEPRKNQAAEAWFMSEQHKAAINYGNRLNYQRTKADWMEARCNGLQARVDEAVADEPRDAAELERWQHAHDSKERLLERTERRLEELELELREIRVENKRLWSLLDLLEKLHRGMVEP